MDKNKKIGQELVNRTLDKFQDGTVIFHNMMGRAWGQIITHNDQEVIVKLWPEMQLAVFAPYELRRWFAESVLTPTHVSPIQC